jgi:type III restriction enzyme
MADGFVKEPAVVTRKNFNPAGMQVEEIERLKLEDGIRLHERVKVDLETCARETENPIVKPFLLVIARDTTHASRLLELMESEGFFEGRYKGKVIQVDSSKTGAEEEAMIERLLKVERTEEPTEIVIHVNMLKEGWDVTNLYTIVPLRAANARILIEQSIGRGLRLPYGHRTGVTAVDRLNIVAHDRFQEIIDEANRPDSPIRLQTVELGPDQLGQRMVTVVSRPRLEARLGLKPDQVTSSTVIPKTSDSVVFAKPEEQEIARIAYNVISKLGNQPEKVPTIGFLKKAEVQAEIVQRVSEQYRPEQLELKGIREEPNEEKFQSDTERKLAIILDRDALKWFKPGKGQFQLFYRLGSDDFEYQPDFVAETTDNTYMLEPKARNELDSAEVQAKKTVALEWCQHASDHAVSYGGKPWRYVLIPHDEIAENRTLEALAAQFRVS